MESENSSPTDTSEKEFRLNNESDGDFSALDLLLSNIRSMKGEQPKNVRYIEGGGEVAIDETFCNLESNSMTNLDFDAPLNPLMHVSEQLACYSPKNGFCEKIPLEMIDGTEFTPSENDIQKLNNEYLSYSSKGFSYSSLENLVDESQLVEKRGKASNYYLKQRNAKWNSSYSNSSSKELKISNSVPQQKGQSPQIPPQNECSKNTSSLPSFHGKQSPVDISNEVFKCGKCQRKFMYKSAFIVHMQRHNKPYSYASILPELNPPTSQNVFKCGKCQRKFMYKSAFTIHMQKHDKLNSYTCILPEPNPATFNLPEPNSGISILPEQNPATSILPELNSTKSKLPEPNSVTSILPEQNSATSILPEPNSVTSILPETNSATSLLPEPNPTTSTPLEPNSATFILPEPNLSASKYVFKCEKCQRIFSNELRRTAHMQNHDEPNSFKCDQCPKKFPYYSDLRHHYVIHSKEVPFKCDHCDYAAKRKQNLTSHIQRHHESHLEAYYSSQHRRKTSNKEFKCEKCTKMFRKSSVFYAHVNNNCDSCPFKCDQCQKQFSFKSNLRNHYRKHKGEKPFKCGCCNYASKWKNVLQTHIKKYHKSQQGD